MTEGRHSWFGFRIAAFAAAGPAGFSLLSALFNWDVGGFLVLLSALIVYASGLVALVLVALIKRKFSSALVLALMIPICGISCFALFKAGDYMRPHARWLFHGHSYKRNLLAESAPIDGSLRHTEWDGWGFAGSDTQVYLVFDPEDKLQDAATQSARKKGVQYQAVPCPAWRIQRLEKDWYSVVLFTDTAWDSCT